MIRTSVAVLLIVASLLIGGAAVFFVFQYKLVPEQLDQAQTQVKEAIEADALAKSTTISGRLVARGETYIVIEITHDIGDPSRVTLTADSQTAVFQLRSDEMSAKETITLSAIPLDSFITATLASDSSNNESLYAKEIIKI